MKYNKHSHQGPGVGNPTIVFQLISTHVIYIKVMKVVSQEIPLYYVVSKT